MAVNRKGFGAAVGNALKSKWRGGMEEALTSAQNEMFVGRVTDIILDSSHPKFKSYGEWNGIGTIFFEAQGNEFVGSNNIVAKPLSPQRSSFPLVNEMVLIFTLPNKEQGQSATSTSYYYINVISIWNSPHHNAYPNPILTTDLPPSQQKDYQQTQAGSVRRVTDGSTEIDLNSPINPSQQTFREQSNIHPLLSFAGDIIYEGRFGNSIRLGGTARPPIPFIPLNDWSNNGENGNPITIIRNGQNPESSDEGWVPVVEDINNDLSSIYITSNQLIPISVKNYNYGTYSTPPTNPDQFKEPQVIINSDRLVFNAKTDSILLSAEKSIFLGTNSSINFTTRKYIIDSPSIELGNGADQPLIKGNLFLDDLKIIMNELSILCSQISKIKEVTAVDVNTGKVASSLAVKGNLATTSNNLRRMIDDTLLPMIDLPTGYKSNVSKTL